MGLTNEDLLAISNLLDNKLQPIQSSFEGLQSNFDGLQLNFDGLELKVDGLQSNFDRLELKVDGLESKVDRLQLKVDEVESNTLSIKSDQLEMRKDIKTLAQRVDETYSLALDAWGASTENRALIRSIGNA